MTKLIADSNIIFSAILNTNSRIGQIILPLSVAPRYGYQQIYPYIDQIKISDSTIYLLC